MAVPWVKILDTVLGLTSMARAARERSTAAPADERLETVAGRAAVGGPLEARLAGVVVAALKEAFDRDHQRLELERDQLEGERQRAEQALRLEMRRQAIDRELGRLRLIAGLAVACWLGTLVFAARLLDGGGGGRAALGIGWLLLLASLGASFSAQSTLARGSGSAEDGATAHDLSPGIAAAASPWLIVLGLAAIGVGMLL